MIVPTIGWQVGDIRTYTFYGLDVTAKCVQDENRPAFTIGGVEFPAFTSDLYWELSCEAFGMTVTNEHYSPSGMEENAEEMAATLILKAIKSGKAALTPVQGDPFAEVGL